MCKDCESKGIKIFKEIEHLMSFEVEGSGFSTSYAMPVEEPDNVDVVMSDILIFAKEKARATGNDVYVYNRTSIIGNKNIVLENIKSLALIAKQDGSTELVKGM